MSNTNTDDNLTLLMRNVYVNISENTINSHVWHQPLESFTIDSCLSDSYFYDQKRRNAFLCVASLQSQAQDVLIVVLVVVEMLLLSALAS